ncbi:MAG TPA: hypothetical protein VJH03_03925 [Blastocatellia bacterium]|nr:hypothetical protein [Blastocatellia bacterium]
MRINEEPLPDNANASEFTEAVLRAERLAYVTTFRQARARVLRLTPRLVLILLVCTALYVWREAVSAEFRGPYWLWYVFLAPGLARVLIGPVRDLLKARRRLRGWEAVMRDCASARAGSTVLRKTN